MNIYQGYVAQAQEEGAGLVGLAKTFGCGVAHLCSNAAYQVEHANAERLLNNPDRLSIGQQLGQLWEGATASTRQAWTSGHKAQAAGRALWLGLSTITATKGLSAAKRAGAEASGINTLSKAGNYYPIREHRLAGPQPPRGPALPGWFKVAVTAQGGSMVVFGAALYLAPWVFAPAWPWVLTSLSAQAVGSWLVPIGLGNLAVLREGDLRRARVPALTSVAYGLLRLGAVARCSDQVRWHQVSAWIWVALLISMIVTGGFDLRATAGGTAKGEPATVR